MHRFVQLVCVHQVPYIQVVYAVGAGTDDLSRILLLVDTWTHSHTHEPSTPGKSRAERVGKQPAFRGLVREPPVDFTDRGNSMALLIFSQVRFQIPQRMKWRATVLGSRVRAKSANRGDGKPYKITHCPPP